MRYILRLELSGFYVSCLPEQALPLVVMREKQVLDCNPPASKLGISAGMGQREAKMLLQQGQFLNWSPEPYLAAQRAWLDIACNFTDILEPDEQHTAYLDLTAHPDPLVIALRAVDAIQELGYRVRWGLAKTKWLACLSAKLEAGARSLQETAEFIWPLPIRLLPISLEARERFEMLGYHTIGQVASLSLRELRDQFRDEGQRIYQLAWGGGHETVRALYPEGCLSEYLYFESPIECLQELEQAAKDLAERIGAGLQEQGICGREVVLVVETEEDFKVLRRTFNKPLASARSVLVAISALLKDISEPICGLRLRLPNLTKANLIQLAIGGESEAEIDGSIRGIQQVFGEKAIQRASEVPTERRVLVLKEWRDATGWR
ncbi:MAG: hypothetical protein JSS72_04910 [Armatimonadetes bacterium]|nr:hypothetical protein [Armatimonadota bacterium]